MAASTKFVCLMVIIGLALASRPCSATGYIVGDPIGWCPALIPNLLGWLTGKDFFVGDVLQFVNLAGLLVPTPVYLVPTLEAYANCDLSAAVALPGLLGNVLYTCSEAKIYYFVGDLVNCRAGLKLAVDVKLAL